MNFRKILFTLFPILEVMSKEQGTSMSEAGRIKQDNANANTPLENELESLPITRDEVKILKSDGNFGEATSLTDPEVKTTEDLIEMIEEMSNRKADTAVLSVAIKAYDDARAKIRTITNGDLAKYLELEYDTKVIKVPELKFVGISFGHTIQWLCQQRQVEQILLNINADAMAKVGDKAINALRAEAVAANWGNQVTLAKGVVRRICNTLPEEDRGSMQQGVNTVYTKRINIYDKDARTALNKQSKDIYDKAQAECNKYVKEFKDALRELDIQYTTEYNDEMIKYNELITAQNAHNNEITAAVNKLRSELERELSSLKINFAK